jgi:hypothetical protein
MNKFAIGLTALGAQVGVSACVHEPTPMERAARDAPVQCAAPNQAQDEARVLREAMVIKAEPITFPAGASTRTEGGQTVSGARLVMRAPDGVSAEDMASILRCHNMRALLGQVDPAAVPDDPFTLPGAWVDIDVKAEHGFLVVKVSADRIWQNLALLRQARAFAEAHRSASLP